MLNLLQDRSRNVQMRCFFFSSSGIEELFYKRDELNKQIQQEEEEKTRLQHDIRVLTEKLSRVTESLDRRLTTRNELDRTIAETEAAYMKVQVKIFCNNNFKNVALLIKVTMGDTVVL